MARLTRKMVSTIRKQLAKLKELDLKKMSDGISHGEKKQWSQYYAGVLKFDSSQTRMVEERDTIRIPMTTVFSTKSINRNSAPIAGTYRSQVRSGF